MHAIVVHVRDHGDDLTPRTSGAFANPRADCSARLVPQLAREVLGYDDDRPVIFEVEPREIAAGDEARADRLEIAGRDVSEPAHRRYGSGVASRRIFGLNRRAAAF